MGLEVKKISIEKELYSKVVKLLHVAMMHPRDYSVDLIGKWMTEKSGGESRNWLYLVKMFRYVDY